MEDKLHQLLCLANVHGIYIVDDAIGDGTVTFARFLSLIKKVEQGGNLEKLNELEEDFDFEEDSPVLELRAKELWDSALPDKHLQYMRLLCNTLPSKDEDLATNLDITRVLKQLHADANLSQMELVGLSPIEWDKQLEDIASRIPTGQRALVLFDQKLNLAKGRFDVIRGIDLVEEIIGSRFHNCFLPGILTYTVNNEGLELTERAKLAAEKNLDASQLFVLTKERLEDLPRFIDGIKKLLLNGPCEEIKLQAISIGLAALGTTKNRLLELDTYDFSHTVLKSSFIEGIWAPDTLFRIIDIIYKDEIKIQLLENNLIPDLNSLLKKANELNSVEIPIDTSKVQTKRYELRRQEIYAEGKVINGLFKPIENGDIFEVTDGTGKGIYILLSQPCDLMIRSGGTRGTRAGHLLKIKSLTEDELKLDIEKEFKEAQEKKLHDFNYWGKRGVIEHIEADPQIVGIVGMPRAHVVDLDILDLTMFNSTGVATLDIAAAPPTALHVGLDTRFVALKANHKKIHDKVEEYKKILVGVRGPLPKKILQEVLPCLSLNDKLATSSLSGTVFSFGIKRIKSLRDPYAQSLLDKYTRYLSRTGDLHDFA